MSRGIFWLLAFAFLSSCVPNRRIVYMQHEQDPRRGALNRSDTLVRQYQTYYSEYTLKPYDIISLNVASITPGEFDFVKKYEEQLGLIRKLNQYDQVNKSGSGGQRMAVGGGVGAGVGGNEGISPLLLDRQQTGFVLDGEGYLELPFVGKLKLAGLTVSQTETFIKEKLKGYFETPVVRVQLLNFHFTILGEVNQEGRYTSFNPNTTVIDALAMAGNLNDFADRSKLKVIRFKGDKANVFYVNALREDLLSQPGFFLQPNDLIIVPPLKARYAKKYGLQGYTTALSLITSTITLIVLIATLNK
jgi:polysaccharide export outer membrane protein